MSEGNDRKAKSKSITLTPDQWARVEAIAKAEFGDRSAYFKALVDADVMLDEMGNAQSLLARSRRATLTPDLITRLEAVLARLEDPRAQKASPPPKG